MKTERLTSPFTFVVAYVQYINILFFIGLKISSLFCRPRLFHNVIHLPPPVL